MAAPRFSTVASLVLGIALSGAADDSVVMHLPPAARALMPDRLDPRQLRSLLEIEHQGKVTLPAPVLLLLADAETRRGDWYEARRLFAKVVGSNPSDEWGNFGRAGLGWMALVRGDLDAAHDYYAQGGATGDLGRVLLALTDAAEGDAAAAETLRRLAAEVVDPDLREVARIGWGYAFYWNGNFRAAMSAFATVRDGPFADDAEYAGALARWQLGDRAPALAIWDALAARRGEDASPRWIVRGLLRLEPRYVFQAGLQRYRKLPPGPHDAQLVAMLDNDGAMMASSALKLFDPSRRRTADSLAGPIGVAARAVDGDASESVGANAPALVTVLPDRTAAPRSITSSSSRSVVPVLLGLLIAVVAALFWRRRPQSRPS